MYHYLDPRCNPYRPDIAADFLRDRVDAKRFVQGIARQVKGKVCDLFSYPSTNAQRISQLLFGEIFVVYDQHEQWAWGQDHTDGYVGYVHSESLDSPGPTATHWVTALATFIYQEPNIKAVTCGRLSFMSRVAIIEEAERFVSIAGGGWIIAQHVTPCTTYWNDILTSARMFLDVPYLWGGRSSNGLDCSGLLQLCLGSIGIHAPRDSDMIPAALTTETPTPCNPPEILYDFWSNLPPACR